MTFHTSDRVSRYLDAVTSLAPLIAEHRDAFDRERRIPETVFDALADAELFRLYLPKAFGGPELSPVEFMQIVEAASALDGSVGWLVANGGGMSRFAGHLPQTTADRIFSDPRAFVVGATGAIGKLAKVEGGYLIDGRWPFGSGSHHATHFMGLAAVPPPEGTGAAMCCYMPRKDIVIEDTWRTSGLRGTGSCHFVASNVFVPDDCAHGFLTCAPTQDGVVYRLPPVSAFAWTVSAVPLGIARGAIAFFTDAATKKGRDGFPTLLSDRETVQATLGRVQAMHRSARLYLIDAMGALVAVMDAGGEASVRARATMRTAGAHAAETALRIIQMLEGELGALAIFESNIFERAARDANAAAKHIAVNPGVFALAGRIELGLDPGTPRF